MLVNNSFWVMISDKQVVIQKGDKGYIRSKGIDILPEGQGIMAEGILISTKGLCHLEDGGTAFNGCTLEWVIGEGQ